MRKRYPMAAVALFVGALLVPESAPGDARPQVPDGQLEVTVRMVQQGKAGQAFVVFTLWCSGGECLLEALTLNQCFDTVGGFFPKVQRGATAAGDLSVVHRANAYEVTWRVDPATVSLRFVHEPSGAGIVLPSMLVDFSGGFVAQPVLSDAVATVQYEPLVSPNGLSVPLKLECPALVPGLDAEKRRAWRTATTPPPRPITQ